VRGQRPNPHLTLLLLIRAEGLPEPACEVRFHPTRRWRLDLAWPELKLYVEVHGGVFTHGRHTRGKGFTSDRAKFNEAVLLGWRGLEVTSAQVRDGSALEWIRRLLALPREA
tara:strand:- start:1888 stop:2223 length:336 start_codon:yes stop_codon:yes gene_type:complete